MQDRCPEQEELKANSRRSRKDEEGRDYKCGCGKKYLSYPALYTHIKTKHNGEQPEGTEKVGTSLVKKPKHKFEDEALRAVQSQMQREDLRILTLFDSKIKGSVPINGRVRRDNVCREVYEAYSGMVKSGEVRLTQRSSLDAVLVVYLLNVGEYVNDRFYDSFLMFAKIVRPCYYTYGEYIYKECFSTASPCVGIINDFRLEECRHVPIIYDFMMRYYIPKEYTEANISLMSLIFYDFCVWMFRIGLSCVKVQLNFNYTIDTSFNMVSVKRPQSEEDDCKKPPDEEPESSSRQPDQNIVPSAPQSDSQASSSPTPIAPDEAKSVPS